jgi:hypothetical protein
MLLDMRTARLKGTAQAIQLLGRDPARGRVFWWLYDEYDAIRASTHLRPRREGGEPEIERT